MLFLFVVLAAGTLALAGFDADPSGAGTATTEVVESDSDPFGAELPPEDTTAETVPGTSAEAGTPFDVVPVSPSPTDRPVRAEAARRVDRVDGVDRGGAGAADPPAASGPAPAVSAPAPVPPRAPASPPQRPAPAPQGSQPPPPPPSDPGLLGRLLGGG
jgi:hypothetical protein